MNMNYISNHVDLFHMQYTHCIHMNLNKNTLDFNYHCIYLYVYFYVHQTTNNIGIFILYFPSSLLSFSFICKLCAFFDFAFYLAVLFLPSSTFLFFFISNIYFCFFQHLLFLFFWFYYLFSEKLCQRQYSGITCRWIEKKNYLPFTVT